RTERLVGQPQDGLENDGGAPSGRGQHRYQHRSGAMAQDDVDRLLRELAPELPGGAHQRGGTLAGVGGQRRQPPHRLALVSETHRQESIVVAELVELFGQLQRHLLCAAEMAATDEVEDAHVAMMTRPYCRAMVLLRTGMG